MFLFVLSLLSISFSFSIIAASGYSLNPILLLNWMCLRYWMRGNIRGRYMCSSWCNRWCVANVHIRSSHPCTLAFSLSSNQLTRHSTWMLVCAFCIMLSFARWAPPFPLLRASFLCFLMLSRAFLCFLVLFVMLFLEMATFTSSIS